MSVRVRFCSAGGVLFGVPDYVPALMKYNERYVVDLQLNTNLVAVDGTRRIARFSQLNAAGIRQTFETDFDILHVSPPQRAPDCVRISPLADSGGWLDVDQHTLRHKKYANIYGLGDVLR